MYSRKAENGELVTFGVSGKLWHGVLVMFDRESESFWTQLDGRAIVGARAGERLEHYPSIFTTWSAWKAEHPDTLVLFKPEDERERKESSYASYFADPERLFVPHLGEELGGIEAKDVVFGVQHGDHALAVSRDLLARVRIVNTLVGSRPVAILHDPDSGYAHAVSRLAQGKVVFLEPLPGQKLPRCRDAWTESELDAGKLEAVRLDRAFWYAWSRSHRGSRVLAD